MYPNKAPSSSVSRDVPKVKESATCGSTKSPSDINEAIDRLCYAVNRYGDLARQVASVTVAVCRPENAVACCDAKCEEDYSTPMAIMLSTLARQVESNNVQLDSIITRCQLTPYNEKP